MIQRIQTIWLLLAAGCGFASLQFPFFVGSIEDATLVSYTAQSNMLILILCIAAATLSLLSIFLFKNRSLQLKTSIAAMLLSLIVLVLYFVFTNSYEKGAIALYAIFSFAVPVFDFLAIRGIYKDEKLLKSVDRLR